MTQTGLALIWSDNVIDTHTYTHRHISIIIIFWAGGVYKGHPATSDLIVTLNQRRQDVSLPLDNTKTHTSDHSQGQFSTGVNVVQMDC